MNLSLLELFPVGIYSHWKDLRRKMFGVSVRCPIFAFVSITSKHHSAIKCYFQITKSSIHTYQTLRHSIDFCFIALYRQHYFLFVGSLPLFLSLLGCFWWFADVLSRRRAASDRRKFVAISLSASAFSSSTFVLFLSDSLWWNGGEHFDAAIWKINYSQRHIPFASAAFILAFLVSARNASETRWTLMRSRVSGSPAPLTDVFPALRLTQNRWWIVFRRI